MRVSPILPDRVASWSLCFGRAEEGLGHAAGDAPIRRVDSSLSCFVRLLAALFLSQSNFIALIVASYFGAVTGSALSDMASNV
jgi:hypothetical protein